jgi:NADH-quinone oxidoreductase subunit E
LPEEAVEHVAEKTGVPVSRIHSLTTFFKAFALEPRGQHLITVCLGTSCHVMGCRTILEKVQRELGVKPGETTEDGRFTLETVNCIGACAVSPVVVVDGETYAKMTITKVNRLLRPLVRSGEQPVAV